VVVFVCSFVYSWKLILVVGANSQNKKKRVPLLFDGFRVRLCFSLLLTTFSLMAACDQRQTGEMQRFPTRSSEDLMTLPGLQPDDVTVA